MANIFTNAVHTTAINDTNAQIYVSPGATESIVHSIYVDGTGTFTLSLNGTTPFASNVVVADGAPVIFDKPINLNAADSITVTTTTAGLNILISILQIS